MKLSNSAKKILNDPVKIKRRDEWFCRLQDLFNGKYGENVMAIKGLCGYPADSTILYTNPEQFVLECLENLAEQVEQYDDETQFVPPCIEAGMYGVHFIDSFFGSHVYYKKETYQWYNERLNSEVGTLQEPDLDKCEIWQIAKRATYAFLKHEVALPIFGLSTIASTLNIAVNLYGEDILESMLMETEKAAHDFAVINNLLVDLHRWYRSVLPERQLQPVISWERTQPFGYGQICGCTTQLISADVYKSQIAPLDNELLGVYPNGGMMHLCGSHSHFMPVFRSMPNLKAIQLNDRAAHDLELYFTGLRGDQIIYLYPCEGMTVDMAMQITGGKRLVLVDRINTPIALK